MFATIVTQEENVMGIDREGLSAVCHGGESVKATGQRMMVEDDLRLIGDDRAAEYNVFRLQRVVGSGD